MVYSLSGNHCYLVNSSLNSADVLVYNEDVYTALVTDLSPFQKLDTACPYTNTSTQTTPNGLEFEVFCDRDASGNDITPWVAVNGSYDHHSDSLDDCMQYCSTMSPKCYGVTFNPSMNLGYRNCYPKGVGVGADTFVSNANSHTALAIFDSNPSTVCDPDGRYPASNEIVFNTSCDVVTDGQNISTLHSPSFNNCMEACATYAPPQDQTGGDCVAVLFQPDGADGYENCYLKATARSQVPRSAWRLGVRLDSTGQPVPGASGDSNSTSNNGGGSKAWIAGPVVGAVAAVAVFLGVCFWCRKRRSRKGLGQPKTKPRSRKSAELDANLTERKELEARQPLATELPGSEDWHDGQRIDASNQASGRYS